MLPFKVALKVPIYVFGKWSFNCLKGNFVVDAPIKRGMIYLGMDIAGYVTTGKSSLRMKKGSKIIFRGNAYISQGCQIFLGQNANLDMGEEMLLGDSVKIICYKNIIIGRRSEVTWESQVTDFNSHFIENVESQQISTIYRPVKIGNYCWIGNRTSVMPGTILPDKVIVTSNSLLNKDYIKQGIKNYSLIGGIPAQLIKKGMKRIYSREHEQTLKKYFIENNIERVSNSVLQDELLNNN